MWDMDRICHDSFHHVIEVLLSTDSVNSCYFDIVGTVYHLVIYMQSNKIQNVVLMSKFIQHLF